ncbi:FMN-dependent NADH-azoreductase [Turicibacter sp. TJ11]|uniref:FMN-dependent NADH-azoreductase n=1 Tax=Turicibacter sp. TJ11 TaxID=2806443 RepID=UPI001F37E2AA|nr:NAD(P)H-dependent oxidoreductase [Turicibacter sp. TJ11]
MKKLLYITVNSKPETQSTCRTVGRALVNEIQSVYPEFHLEELDLYQEHIPRLEYQYFESRNCMIHQEALEQLPPKEQKEVHQIVKLCDQFKEADVIVIAAPMWSLSFPAPLKEYIDCIVQVGRTITFDGLLSMPKGLLNDKPRTVVYVQSSGANVMWMMNPILNKGLRYIEDIMKFMGIKKFEELLADGTGETEEERQKAIEQAKKKIPSIVKHLEFSKE